MRIGDNLQKTRLNFCPNVRIVYGMELKPRLHQASNEQHVAGQHVAWCKRGLTVPTCTLRNKWSIHSGVLLVLLLERPTRATERSLVRFPVVLLYATVWQSLVRCAHTYT